MTRRQREEVAVRRWFHLATGLLAALTAVALLGAAIAVRPPGLPAAADRRGEAANRALAYAFYDAANLAIADGDPAPLAALLAPGFVDRSLPPDREPDGDGLVRRLLAVRAAAPEARLVAEAVAADGDLVVVAVHAGGAVSSPFLGLRLDAERAAWGPVDVFRIADGRIAERRAAVDHGVPVPLLRVVLDVPPPALRILAVARLTLAPGAVHAAPALSGPRLVLAETGAVAVEPAATGSAPAPPTPLRAGEHILLDPRAGFAVQNTGPSAAVVLDIAIAEPPPAGPGGVPPAPVGEGVAIEVLATDLLVAVPSRSAVLAVGRATLGPGERLAWAPAAGPVLLHVEAGAPDLAITGSAPWVGGSVGRRSAAGVTAALVPGGGALLEPGAEVEIRAALDGPTTLLVLTLLPADERPPFDVATASTPSSAETP